MSFLQFASNNVRRNSRAYFAYFLSSAFMVMIFFTYAMFFFHPDIGQTGTGGIARQGMQIAEVILYVFSFLFVLYSTGSFLKARSKEFGILTLLGAENRQMNLLIFLENLLIGLLSIGAGIVSGLLLSKLFLLLASKTVVTEQLGFYFPAKAILLTIAAFVLLFIVISMATVMMIRRRRILEMIKGASKPKEEPKTSWILSLLGLVLLVVSCLILSQDELTFKMLCITAVTGILGTYFFFTQLSVMVIRCLKRSRRFLWQGPRLLWISEMAYKLKDNARVLFMVTVVISIACMSTAFVLSIEQQSRRDFESMTFQIEFNSYEPATADANVAKFEDQLRKEGLAYEKWESKRMYHFIRGSSGEDYEYVIPVSSYNKAASILGGPQIERIQSDEAIRIVPPNKEAPTEEMADLDLGPGEKNVRITKNRVFNLPGSTLYLVVADDVFSKILNERPQIDIMQYYKVPQWDHNGLVTEDSSEYKISKRLEDHAGSMSDAYARTRAVNYIDLKNMTGIFSFVGVFIAALFSLSSASFLYFKLFVELDNDRAVYRSLSKVGLDTREMKRSSAIQIGVLFLLPVLVAAAQTAIVMNGIKDQFDFHEVWTPIFTAAGAFLLAQVIYFLIIRSRYVRQLKKVMV
ncbi:ABC transporter permease [Paenibacillus sp. CAA11]|uniref:ABC transporter permease n=1 Tax=Paenibacillus sp. CAA11 TaxID=1532905 RepID=UPI00131EE4E3|nr:ABC transporter permease [Paenibacillus sp. CAA11]